MSFNLLLGLALAFLAIWSITSYFFWRIQRSNQARRSKSPVQPALQLADQWLAESQKKMEELSERMEQPLGTAQNELLELRLEAGRVPQGIKDLKLVRESLRGDLKPALSDKSLQQMARFYLREGSFREGGSGVLYLETSLGAMPCVEAAGEGAMTEDGMRAALSLFQSVSTDTVSGGFLYFPSDDRYRDCLANPGWMEGLRSRRVIVVDFKGFSAILMSLRLWVDADRLIRVFETGVGSTRSLLGQSDRMGEALSTLGADSLKARTVIDGGVTDGFGRPEGGKP